MVDPSQSDESDAGADEPIPRPVQGEAKSPNRDVSPTQVDDPNTTDNNSLHLNAGPTGDGPQTPLVPAVDTDLQDSQLNADADAAADWDMVDAPTDDIHTAGDAALLTAEFVMTPEKRVSGAFPSSYRGNKTIHGQARKLMLEFVQILRG